MDALEAGALLVLFTFLPPVFFAWRLRSAERSRREPWHRIFAAFAWGALVAVLIAGFGEEFVLHRYFQADEPLLVVGATSVSLLAIVVAPIIEELSKALGLLVFQDADPEPENGYVYGGAVGLGFAATENLLYVGSALVLQGQDVAVALGVYRGVATVALHASATAISGYGVWRFRFARSGLRRAVGLALLPFSLATAILVHAAYNLVASGDSAAAALFALAFALLVFAYVRGRVRRLDRRGAAW
jgi:RsiW-degrading membrane proteinase PrsW (M82 family)